MSDDFSGAWHAVWDFPKLKGSENWRFWKTCLISALKYDEHYHVLTDDPPPPISPQKDISDFNLDDVKTLALIHSKCEEGPSNTINHCTTAKEAYEILERHYAPTGFMAKHFILRKLITTTISSPGIGGDVEAYIHAHTIYRNDLKDLDNTFPDWMFCSALLRNLEGRYRDFVATASLQKDLPTFDTLTSQLRDVERYESFQRQMRR